MGNTLRRWLKQTKPLRPEVDAQINLMIAAGVVRSRMDEALGPYDLTVRQYNVLRVLRGAHPKGYSRAEITGRVFEQAPDMTRLLRRLAQRGLVSQSRLGDDRREVVTRITKRGLALLHRLNEVVHEQTNAMHSRLTITDCHALSRACEKLYADLLPAREAGRHR